VKLDLIAFLSLELAQTGSLIDWSESSGFQLLRWQRVHDMCTGRSALVVVDVREVMCWAVKLQFTE
jgi:hypothetical protein